MHLTLSPQAGLPGQAEMTIHVAGDVITIDGAPYDLGAVPEGGEGWPDEGPFIGAITRTGGVIHVLLPVRLDDTAADDQPDSPWIFPDATGPVKIPATRKPEPEATE